MKKSLLNIIVFGAFIVSSCSDNTKDFVKNEVEEKGDTINKTVKLNYSYSIFDSTDAVIKSYLLSPIKTRDTLHRYFYNKEKKQIIHNSGLGFFAMIKYGDDFSASGKISIRFYAPNFYPYQNGVYFSQTLDTTINEDMNTFLKVHGDEYSTTKSKDGKVRLVRRIYSDILGKNGFEKEFDFKLNIQENNALFIDLFVIDKNEDVIFSRGHIIEFLLKDKDLKIYDGNFKFDFPKESI